MDTDHAPQLVPQKYKKQLYDSQATSGRRYQHDEAAKSIYIAHQKEEYMEITNIETIPGKTITTHYGLVCGSTVRSKNAFKDIGAAFKNMFGGELKNYTRLLEETRQEAISRMITQASALGANAIVNVRFATSDVAAGAAEIYIYGTAVRVE